MVVFMFGGLLLAGVRICWCWRWHSRHRTVVVVVPSSTAHIPQRGERRGSCGLLTSMQPRLARRKRLRGGGEVGGQLVGELACWAAHLGPFLLFVTPPSS